MVCPARTTLAVLDFARDCHALLDGFVIGPGERLVIGHDDTFHLLAPLSLMLRPLSAPWKFFSALPGDPLALLSASLSLY